MKSFNAIVDSFYYAKWKIGDYYRVYNTKRKHRSLNRKTPEQIWNAHKKVNLSPISPGNWFSVLVLGGQYNLKINKSIMNFLINTFYLYLEKYNEKGLEASIYAITVIAVLNCLTLINIIMSISGNPTSTIVTYVIISVICGIWLNRTLERKYLGSKEFENLKLARIFLIIPPLYFIGSILMFVVSFRLL